MSGKLKRFKEGDIVRCPADRGDKAYLGKVVGVSGIVQENYQHTPYTWVEVMHLMSGRKSVWPSNRLNLA